MPEPIGSIIAYGGEIPSPVPPNPTSTWEDFNGWLLCDGRELSASPADPYWALFGAIGFAWGAAKDRQHFNIPDLRGYFLRGVDPSRQSVIDPDNLARTNLYAGGNMANLVGSIQSFATAPPNKTTARIPATDPAPSDTTDPKFWIPRGGAHHHYLNVETNATREVDPDANPNTITSRRDVGGISTEDDGLHAHDIKGGNRETRPVNAYVHWIIRAI